MKTNPLLQVKKDLKLLAQLAVDCATSLPADGMQVDIERKIQRILKPYRLKVKERPKYYATK